MVWRVSGADGRPDELVLGVGDRLLKPPLAALNNILVTGDNLQVFNGICGAESGRCRSRHGCASRCCFPQPRCRSARGRRTDLSSPAASGQSHFD